MFSTSTTGISIHVVSDNPDDHSWSEDPHGAWTDLLVSVKYVGGLRVRNVAELVTKVGSSVGRGKMHRLHILGHGMPNYFEVGKDTVTEADIDKFTPMFAKLRPLFTGTDAIVHLHHCYIGLSQKILTHMSKAMGVTVVGATDQDNPVLGFTWGGYAAGHPNGRYQVGVPRPSDT